MRKNHIRGAQPYLHLLPSIVDTVALISRKIKQSNFPISITIVTVISLPRLMIVYEEISVEWNPFH